ncbi:hypothetical protein [Micromonospora sp. NPDC005237]|uniref:hypothetical protein n=1 Tax=Micromonospora sp. NPDC005237 TaxID=3155113 RepID=UPI0033BC529A
MRELFETRSSGQQAVIVAELKALIRSSQERETFGRFRDYNPSGRNLLGRVAAYLGGSSGPVMSCRARTRHTCDGTRRDGSMT